MNHLETFLFWSVLSFEIILCGFVFTRKVQRILPFFATYTYVVLAGVIGVWLIYQFFGFYSLTSYYAYWVSLLLNASARSLAIAELCRYGLRAYRGIWALVWRVLIAFSAVLLVRTGFDAWGSRIELPSMGRPLTATSPLPPSLSWQSCYSSEITMESHSNRCIGQSHWGFA